MLNKQAIEYLKQHDLAQLYQRLRASKDNKEILFILENLGYLPENFDGDQLLHLLLNAHDEIRLWTVKNLGKLKNAKYLHLLFEVAQNDADSMVRREAVSSIGRMRTETAVPLLLELLQDNDPKVVLQAIRGLLVFKRDARVQDELRKLLHHPNEMIQSVIAREFAANGDSTKRAHMSHTDSPDFMRNTVVSGDVRDVLQCVPDESVHLTFTSPPYYNARDYSIYQSYAAYLDFLTAVFSEVHRITKEGRFFVLNTSPVIVPRVSRAHASKRYPIPFDIHPRLTQIGWEFIDDIVWAKPESSVKNRNAGFLQHRKPLGYKPNPVTEYLMVYRKKTDKLLDWNIHQYDGKIMQESLVADGYETSNLWEIDPTFDRVHSAVFPIELCNRVILYYSYVGDLVFDPFAGSGTVGRAAEALDRHFFLTEQEETYFERMRQDLGRKTLFNPTPTRFLNLQEFGQLATAV
jgi:DNA modification methylase